MALETTRSLGQLKAECKKLNLTVDIGKKERKEDYIRALRNYHIEVTHNNSIPKSLELMLEIDCPMLCKRYQELKEHEQDALWNSPEWYVEKKIDGARMVMFKVDESLDFYSRNLSVTDYLPVSYSSKIWTGYADLTKISSKFILDSEIVCTNSNVSTILGNKGVVTETGLQATTALLALNDEQSHELQKSEAPLQFMIFDCLWFNGEWLLDKPLRERRKYMKQAYAELKEAGVNVALPPSSYKNRKAFYNYCIKSGGEGVVFKNINSPYIATTSRRRDGWIKLKRTTSEALGDTIDGYISGFVQADPNKSWSDLIGGLEVSVTLRLNDGTEVEHMIARVSNIPMELRQEMTTQIDNKPALKPEYYGKVVEVDGQCITSRAKRLKHAVLVRWRPDRSPDTCILDEDFLNSNIL